MIMIPTVPSHISYAALAAVEAFTPFALAMFSIHKVGTTPTLSFPRRSFSNGLGLLSLFGWNAAWVFLYLATLSR